MDPAEQDVGTETGRSPCTERREASLCQNEQPQYTTYHNYVPPQYPQILYPQGIPASAYGAYPTGHLPSATNGQQVQAAVVMTQPGGCVPAEIINTFPPNYVILSVLSVFFCLPIGLAAITMSCQVNAALKRGNLAAARRASHITKILICCGIAAGFEILAMYILYLGLY